MKVGTKLFLMSAGTAVIILVVGLISLVSLTSLINANQQVSHTKDVLQELDLLRFNLADCVSAQRGYIISGKQPFLDAYEDLVIATGASLDRIEKLVGDNPEQLGRVTDMRQLVKERLASLEATCVLYRAKGSEAAFDRIRNGKSLIWRVELQKKIAIMKETEQLLLQQRFEDAKRSATSSELTVIAGMALALVFVAVSNFLFGSTILTCVKQLITASENIKYGRFDLSANTNTNDEFADLAAAFNSMGQQLLIASRKLKEQKNESDMQTETIAQLQSQADGLKTRIASISQLSTAERRALESYKTHVSELEQWLNKVTEMGTTFQDLDRTNQNYIQRITIFNEGAVKTTASMHSELDFKQDVDQASLAHDFNSRIDKLIDLNKSIEKLIGGVELIALSAEMESARADKPDKTLGVFISTLKEKTAEAKSARNDVHKYVTELKNSTIEVLDRYSRITDKLVSSKHNASRIAQDLDKQTEVCHELRILFADATVQKYVNFLTTRRSFTQELKNDVEHRGLLAEQLHELAAPATTNTLPEIVD